MLLEIGIIEELGRKTEALDALYRRSLIERILREYPLNEEHVSVAINACCAAMGLRNLSTGSGQKVDANAHNKEMCMTQGARPSDDCEEGKLVEGERNGRGILSYPDGTRYEGDLVDGRQTGYGTLYAPNGSILKKGQFINNSFIEIDTMADVISWLLLK